MSWTSERYQKIVEWVNKHEYENFIDEDEIHSILEKTKNASKEEVRAIIAKAKQNASNGAMLSPYETAILLNNSHDELWEEIFDAATWVKTEVYGDRMVLFSPLYISSPCVNNCKYCGFAESNTEHNKKILREEELKNEVTSMLDMGQKRLVAVYGEHPKSDHNFIAQSVRTIYGVKKGNLSMRRVNINAAPLFEDEYKIVHNEGIGTFQVFQETYHRQTYKENHPENTLKGIYDWRVFALHRALKAGLDDVAIGALLGLYDYKFEILGLLFHAMSLEKYFGIGPHTISFPRIKKASGANNDDMPYALDDDEFLRAIAIIRLMCPFTGTILTAREEPELRNKAIQRCGISQMDAGTNIEIGGYSKDNKIDELNKQQFQIGDHRCIDEFVINVMKKDRIPSFCTSCYREGRTGDHFMPYAKNAKIKYLCLPNAILTLKEYLLDYGSEEARNLGENVIIPKYLKELEQNLPHIAEKVRTLITAMENGERDCHL
ncbi:[FeFe] hydrogenase H-cluster radical SAM maturase HydG [Campylobacter pinnipediorum]|uniref:[FeFe] hydrogenase H-cluster radical SAM maturase HydG n=1 Tax=Campylobacter pinnipediorum TaxID=1965231 RepID=UPI000994BABD|nr:[FeFe] hydrogenase H-cluster radical SAM maturase HydG [Campylobacter pinnipediorum]AQW80834.1 [FeFe] hydrogenase H-cluster radical SAM maturase HydG [Campylobacter pinnipediorum subsp. pinnipediorum]AQW82454.1 [FeFe] hydrogenase H-cluster radical SAM maturase HydG [Campylobacter pinnipediorum subsp. pinnipediorum]AQW84123.1 [FeFe] hydrogenase H-cluster radical SAM maturase HydG [Campylobacter pinnipediorum subsp. pinnipediorum]